MGVTIRRAWSCRRCSPPSTAAMYLPPPLLHLPLCLADKHGYLTRCTAGVFRRRRRPGTIQCAQPVLSTCKPPALQPARTQPCTCFMLFPPLLRRDDRLPAACIAVPSLFDCLLLLQGNIAVPGKPTGTVSYSVEGIWQVRASGAASGSFVGVCSAQLLQPTATYCHDLQTLTPCDAQGLKVFRTNEGAHIGVDPTKWQLHTMGLIR